MGDNNIPADDVTVDRPPTDIHPKVAAGTVGAGLGAAVAELFIWFFERGGTVDVPDMPITIILVSLLAFLSGWLKRSGFDPYASGYNARR